MIYYYSPIRNQKRVIQDRKNFLLLVILLVLVIIGGI